ncbi:hypothetical protein AURDEDRAFT_114615 [Auricularia subglabra TFB-10046 SS5]|nr:hypothetical protein AURDEDRAFT_114615 [Auricularia subglabra TFB-10046 SS5]
MGRSTRRAGVTTQAEEGVIPSSDAQPEEAPDKSDLEREVFEDFQREHYEAVEMLPLQLRRQSSLIRELDEQGIGELDKVVRLLSRYKELRERLAKGEPPEDSSVNGMNDTRALLAAIGQALSEYVRTSEEKFSISSNAYDSVDRHVRAMDAMIKEQEAVIAFGHRAPVFGFHAGHQNPSQVVAADGSKAGVQKPPVDMPIDPNEPLYCFCRNVSYGEMVACDDEDCPNEWFHLACVGLTAVPKSNKWFCADCKQKHETHRKKK